MASQFEIGIVLKAFGAGAVHAAITQIGGSMDRLKRQSEAAREVHARLGDAIAMVGGKSGKVDGLTQAWQRLGRSLRDVESAMQRIERAQARVAQHREAIGNLKADAFAVVGMAAPVVTAVREAAGFGDAIKDIAIVGELSREQEQVLGQSLRAVARETNQSARDMAAGVSMLIANGKEAQKTAEQAGLLGKFTTATRSRAARGQRG